MPISDIYTARSGVQTVNSASATPLQSLVATAAKRSWVVGVRVDIVFTGSAAGQNVLFQLARPGNTANGSTSVATTAHDFSAPVSLSTCYTAWTTPPTVGTVLWEQELPLTSGSSWEEFPPANYEWQIPAIANNAANNGLHLFVTCSTASSSTFVSDLVFSE
jgi:hypothetical protein